MSDRRALPELPRVLLFDLDDTLVRFTAGQPDFWRLTLEDLLPNREDRAELLAQLGRASEVFWSDPGRAYWGRQHMHEARRRITTTALGALGVEPELCVAIAEHMTEAKEAHVRPFEGAIETLCELGRRGHRLGLLTNGSGAFQRRKLTRFALEPYFEFIAIEGELGYGKPDPRVFRAALEHFAIAPDECWMIGDNLEADVGGAQGVGIVGIWHDAHGRGLPADGAVAPAHVVHSVRELCERSG